MAWVRDTHIGHIGFSTFVEAESELYSLFTGRYEDLKDLDRMLNNPRGSPIIVVGPRGVGKTAFCHMYARTFGKRFRKVIFSSAQRFLSFDAFLAHILIQISSDMSLETREFNEIITKLNTISIDSTYLLIVDDVHVFNPQDIARLINEFRLLGDRIKIILTALPSTLNQILNIYPYCGPIENVLPFHLGYMKKTEIEEMITKRISLTNADPQIGQNFLENLRNRGVNYEELSPRFILELANQFFVTRDFDNALEETRNKYFESISHLVIIEHQGKLAALPATKDYRIGLVAETGFILPAVPYVIVSNVRYHWKKQIDEFEEILNSPNAREQDFQHFFTKYPHFLKGLEYRRVIPQPVLERETGENLIPDFLLQPLTSEYADILDLKLHRAKLTVSSKNRIRFSQSVQEAIAQVREYRDYFEESNHRAALYKKYGIKAYRPNAVVIIGRSIRNISEEKVKQLQSDAPSYFKILTYDDLHMKMKHLAECYSL